MAVYSHTALLWSETPRSGPDRCPNASGGPVRLRPDFLLVLLLASAALATPALADILPTFDAARLEASGSSAVRVLPVSAEAARLQREFTVRSIDERYGVPSFVWAPRDASPTSGMTVSLARPGQSADAAARAHLSGMAPMYRLSKSDLQGTRLRQVHDIGRGAIIASYTQVVDGI